MALRLVVIVLLAGWVARDAGASTSSTSKQCPESGGYVAESQEEVDAFAETFPECGELTWPTISTPWWVYSFGSEKPDPVTRDRLAQDMR